MPSHPCRHPTCTDYLKHTGDYCAEHEAEGKRERSQNQRFYDQHLRDADAKAFYNSAAWQRARAAKLAANPVCERCRHAFAVHVHHRIPLKRCTPAQRVDQTILMSLCGPTCHNAEEKETSAG